MFKKIPHRLVNVLRNILYAAAWIGLCVAPALAAPQLLGSFQDWDAYSVTDAQSSTCYALSSPKKLDRPNGLGRSPSYFLLTAKRPQRGSLEPSLIAGYALQPGQPVKILIGDQRFSMFSKDDGAWVKDPADERRLVEALKGGTNLVVQGISVQGATLVDHYSLRGLTAALTAVDQACK